MNQITPRLIEPEQHLAGCAIHDSAAALVLKVTGEQRRGGVQNRGAAIGRDRQGALPGGQGHVGRLQPPWKQKIERQHSIGPISADALGPASA